MPMYNEKAFKLLRLAAGTPYPHEARAALIKARQLFAQTDPPKEKLSRTAQNTVRVLNWLWKIGLTVSRSHGRMRSPIKESKHGPRS